MIFIVIIVNFYYDFTPQDFLIEENYFTLLKHLDYFLFPMTRILFSSHIGARNNSNSNFVLNVLQQLNVVALLNLCLANPNLLRTLHVLILIVYSIVFFDFLSGSETSIFFKIFYRLPDYQLFKTDSGFFIIGDTILGGMPNLP